MLTPEGKVKAKISRMLKNFRPHVYYEMSVPHGFGKKTVDYTGCAAGWFFGVEAKRDAKAKPTALQEAAMSNIRAAGGRTFVVHDDPTLHELRLWIDSKIGAKR